MAARSDGEDSGAPCLVSFLFLSDRPFELAS